MHTYQSTKWSNSFLKLRARKMSENIFKTEYKMGGKIQELKMYD